MGASQGDFATVINVQNGVVVHSIVADSGPRHKIGEGSLALRNSLQLQHRQGVDLIWIVYPGTRKTPAWPVTLKTIEEEGARLFAQFGGISAVNREFGTNIPNKSA